MDALNFGLPQSKFPGFLAIILTLLQLSVFSNAQGSYGQWVSGGLATFYGGDDTSGTWHGACGYGNLRSTAMGSNIAAAGFNFWKGGHSCGGCYELRCENNQYCLPGTSTVVTVTDYCATCPEDWHFDMSVPAFANIARTKAGRIPVAYRRVPCSYSTNVVIQVNSKSHKWWLSVLVRNQAGAGDIGHMQVKRPTDPTWIDMDQSWGSYYVFSPDGDLTSPLSFRITTLYDGKTLQLNDCLPPNPVPGQLYYCNDQFPLPQNGGGAGNSSSRGGGQGSRTQPPPPTAQPPPPSPPKPSPSPPPSTPPPPPSAALPHSSTSLPPCLVYAPTPQTPSPSSSPPPPPFQPSSPPPPATSTQSAPPPSAVTAGPSASRHGTTMSSVRDFGTWVGGSTATFYGSKQGTGLSGACGYGPILNTPMKPNVASVPGALFSEGLSCGACYEVLCVSDPRCIPGARVRVTVTDYCPPSWCPSASQFVLSVPAFTAIAKQGSGGVPIQYRRVPCTYSTNIALIPQGHPWWFSVLVRNEAGAGDVGRLQVKRATDTAWTDMHHDWGQNWVFRPNGNLSSPLSFRLTTRFDNVTVQLDDCIPPYLFPQKQLVYCNRQLPVTSGF